MKIEECVYNSYGDKVSVRDGVGITLKITDEDNSMVDFLFDKRFPHFSVSIYKYTENEESDTESKPKPDKLFKNITIGFVSENNDEIVKVASELKRFAENIQQMYERKDDI